MRAMSVAIVGPGNLGSALAVSLAGSSVKLDSIVARPGGRSLQKARVLAKRVGCQAVVDVEMVKANVLWFCVPDSMIQDAAKLFANLGSLRGRIALHSSGALTSDELDVVRQKGARVASVHPLMTFVGQSAPDLRGVPFAMEGDREAVQVARVLVKKLGGDPYSIRKQDKVAYHAWATFASPLLTALLATTQQVAKLAGLRPDTARRRMTPILLQTLANYSQYGAARGFSGPIVRGDVETVRRHLRVLRRVPQARDAYVALARAAVQDLPVKRRGGMKRALSW